MNSMMRTLFSNSFKYAYFAGFGYTFIDNTIDENSMPLIERILTSHVIGSMSMIYPVTAPYYLYVNNKM